MFYHNVGEHFTVKNLHAKPCSWQNKFVLKSLSLVARIRADKEVQTFKHADKKLEMMKKALKFYMHKSSNLILSLAWLFLYEKNIYRTNLSVKVNVYMIYRLVFRSRLSWGILKEKPDLFLACLTGLLLPNWQSTWISLISNNSRHSLLISHYNKNVIYNFRFQMSGSIIYDCSFHCFNIEMNSRSCRGLDLFCFNKICCFAKTFWFAFVATNFCFFLCLIVLFSVFNLDEKRQLDHFKWSRFYIYTTRNTKFEHKHGNDLKCIIFLPL